MNHPGAYRNFIHYEDIENILRPVLFELSTASVHKPRDMRTRELRNVQLTFADPLNSRWLTWPSRKLNLNYIKTELRWYLKGDPSDLSIVKRAAIWREHINDDDTLNSNYGRAWFREGQLLRCARELAKDPASRRAVVVIAQPHMFLSEVKDVPCTLYQSFMVRNDCLQCATHMRSQDAILGLGNDLPAFTFMHELLAAALQLPVGCHTLNVDSFHVYERHWNLLDAVLEEQVQPVECPKITYDEAVLILDPSQLYDKNSGPFLAWLHEENKS